MRYFSKDIKISLVRKGVTYQSMLLPLRTEILNFVLMRCVFFLLQHCVKALDVTWHKDHFNCSSCEVNFNTKGLGYHEFEGKAYCEPCYDIAALKPCKGCNKHVKDKVLKALGGYWHATCLICQVRYTKKI